MKKLDLLSTKHIHMTGIGGIGMSALADLLTAQGIFISGSDMKHNRLISRLEAKGCKVNIGHSKVYGAPDALVRSYSVTDDNSEVIDARKRGIPIVERSELLRAMIQAKRRSISVCGTHGKTTTTSMTSYLLEKAGLDPSILIGGVVDFLGGNSKTGKSDIFVTETDESDGFIAELRPRFTIVTNLEKEHMEHYKTEKRLLDTFKIFFKNAPKDGVLVYHCDDKNLSLLSKNYPGKIITYGFSKHADLCASRVKEKGFSTDYIVSYRRKKLGSVTINVPGRHNVLNSLAAIAMLIEFGVPFKKISGILSGFRHAKRRFEVQYNDKGVMLVEDYAHHPTEIKTVIKSARILKPKRVIAVFQPHRYTRTKFLEKEFGPAFKGVDKLILTDIYSANEKPIPGVSAENILKRVKQRSVKDVCLMRKNEIAAYASSIAQKGDIILVMGAGDINQVVPEIKARLIKAGVMPCLPAIKGEIKYCEPLSKHTTFGIGGPARIWVEPRDEKDLRSVIMFSKKNRIKTFTIGWGANILANDIGFNGIIIKLSGEPFNKITRKGTAITAGAGVALSRLILFAAKYGLSGFEGLVGIPGTVGGALCMNAGFKTTIGDFVTGVTVLDRNGTKRNLSGKKLKFFYRGSNLKDYVILRAAFRLKRSTISEVRRVQTLNMDKKKGTQPLGDKSAGCVFMNPPSGESAGRMIDSLGFKGKTTGGAKVSEKHANFIINFNNASSKDVVELIENIKCVVSEKKGIELKEEILHI